MNDILSMLWASESQVLFWIHITATLLVLALLSLTVKFTPLLFVAFAVASGIIAFRLIKKNLKVENV